MGCMVDEKLKRPISGGGTAWFHLTYYTGDDDFECDVEVDDGVFVTEYYRAFPFDKWSDSHYDKFVDKFCRDYAYRMIFRRPVNEQLTLCGTETVQTESGPVTITSYPVGAKALCKAKRPGGTLWAVVEKDEIPLQYPLAWRNTRGPGKNASEILPVGKEYLDSGFQVVCVSAEGDSFFWRVQDRWIGLGGPTGWSKAGIEFLALPESIGPTPQPSRAANSPAL